MGLTDASIMPVLVVDDLDRAIAFYRDKLGLGIRLSDELPGSAIVEVGSKGYLFLYKTDFKRGENTVASFVVKDLEATVDELRGRGVTFEEYDLPGLRTVNGIVTMGDNKSAWFKDSEGNTIAISTDMADSLSKAA